ncbi:hypothetical protein EZV62_020277 [Acer yangbiense]|uniref:Peroxidase n=1 Tax=Acer yangbiense TaxID=1000413 RepID=A0A5C7HDP7_9ROSI|nr:hypothetical protein EZV62_020277 [Acer yangbiense]
MASTTTTTSQFFIVVSIISLLACNSANGQLSVNFYARTCSNLQTIVRNVMRQTVIREPRMGASILRLFFHDCFVQGCDGSILLDDTGSFTGEQNATPNMNSARGYEVIDAIKTRVEAACNNTLGGQSWQVPLGRRDSRTASFSSANSDLPSPFADLPTLISMFAAKGLTARDMTILSGGHAIGFSQCSLFRTRIYNETNIDPAFATARRANCPFSGGDTNLGPLDSTPNRFDNNYYQNLVARRGLLHSDQVLFNGGSQDATVRTYSINPAAFLRDFGAAMVKMGNISPLTGTNGEIRRSCGVINS